MRAAGQQQDAQDQQQTCRRLCVSGTSRVGCMYQIHKKVRILEVEAGEVANVFLVD